MENTDFMPKSKLDKLFNRVCQKVPFLDSLPREKFWDKPIEICKQIEADVDALDTILLNLRESESNKMADRNDSPTQANGILARVYILLYYRHKDEKLYTESIFPQMKKYMGLFGTLNIKDAVINFWINKVIEDDNKIKEMTKEENVVEKKDMVKSVLEFIPSYHIHVKYHGWRNGKKGVIIPNNNIYRFYEEAPQPSKGQEYINENEEDNPIVAKGIVARWLEYKDRELLILKRLKKTDSSFPQDMRGLFDKYTEERYKEFIKLHHDDADSWEYEWEYKFYSEYIIPEEIKLNEISKALFDYITDDDIKLIQSVMDNYIKYLEKCRSDRGIIVNSDLLVLRTVEHQDLSYLENMEDYEFCSIFDKLEKDGYILVAWVEGHKPEACRLLDKGRVYIKELEENVEHRFKQYKNNKQNPNIEQQTPEEKKDLKIKPISLENRGRKSIDIDTIISSFNYSPNIENRTQRLQVFFNYLKRRYIANDTDQQDFINMFMNITTSKKVTWIGTIKSLRYLFKTLEEKNIITYDKHFTLWQMLAARFQIRMKNKKSIDDSMKGDNYEIIPLKVNNLRNGGKIPENDTELDKIISILNTQYDFDDILEDYSEHNIDDEKDAKANDLNIRKRRY